MKREKRNFFRAVLLPVFLLLALAASPTLSEAASKDAAQASARVMDEAGLLSDADRTSLEKALADVEAAHKVKIAACTVKDLKGEKAGSAANKIVDKLAGSAENGAMVLLVAPKDRDWYLATDKKMKGRITDGVGTDYLSGKFLPAFSKDDYASGFKAYAATADEMLAYYEREKKPFTPPPSVLGAGTRTATDSTAQTKNKDAEWCSVEDLQALSGQKRYAKMARLNLSVLP